MKNSVLMDEHEELSGGSLSELRELRRLCLRNLDGFRSIVGPNRNHGRKLEFKTLNHLAVCGCKRLKYVLPLYVLKDLQQLNSIDIGDCERLEQVFADEQQEMTSNVMEGLPLLRSIKLSNLPELASLCSVACHVISNYVTQMTLHGCPKFIFTFAHGLGRIEEHEPSENKPKEMIVTPSELERLDLRQVDHLENMCKDPLVSFRSLAYLQLEECNKLEYLFSLSMARKLSCLQELKIISCQRIQQIVKREAEETASSATNPVEFPQLRTLILVRLPKFAGSTIGHHGSRAIKWLALRKVLVKGCPSIQNSMLGTVDRPLLTDVTVEDCVPWQKENLGSNISHLFNLTDELSKLEKLAIQDLKQLKTYMEMDLQDSSFTKLKSLEAMKCDNELIEFLSILFRRSDQLETLTVKSCELLEQVFDLTEFVAEQVQRSLRFPNLREMHLISLPKLKCIWNKDPMGILELGKLAKLEIIGCGLLKSPLSTSLLEKLVNLEELKMESCNMVEQVVEGDTAEMQDISFPNNLKDLQLVSLPRLIKFSTGHCDFRLPNLLSLRIEKCPELDPFTNGFLTIEGTSDHAARNKMTMVHACSELKNLKLADLKVVKAVSLRRLEKLEKLAVRNCSSLGRLVLPSDCFKVTEIEISGCNILEEICTDDPGQKKTDEKTFRDLGSMVLEDLPKLSFLSLETCEFPSLKKLRIVNCPLNKPSELVLFDIKEDSPAGEAKMKIPPQLELLELSELPKMQLWHKEPQTPVFENLASLKIIGCGGLEKLFSISVAQHLSSLKWLTLYKCESMVQVLGGGGENSRRVSVFKKLETLVLKHLPKLTSFCEEEDVDFDEFPELNMVRVEHVPNMITFVKRFLKTPKLKQVHVTYITKCWLGDLNETIKYLHENHDKLKDEVWESEPSSTTRHWNRLLSSALPLYRFSTLPFHYTDAAESSAQASLRFKEAAETESHYEGDKGEITEER